MHAPTHIQMRRTSTNNNHAETLTKTARETSGTQPTKLTNTTKDIDRHNQRNQQNANTETNINENTHTHFEGNRKH